MSERHGTGEGKEAVLRRELAEAIAIRTAAASGAAFEGAAEGDGSKRSDQGLRARPGSA